MNADAPVCRHSPKRKLSSRMSCRQSSCECVVGAARGLEELCLRKQYVFWAPGKLGPMCMGHQLAERAFIVVVPRHGPVLLDCNCIVLGCCDRDMVASDPPPRCGIAVLSSLTLYRCTLAIVDGGLLHDSFSMGIICVKLGILALIHFS